MTYNFLYGAAREYPCKVIHVLRVVDELFDDEELDKLAERMRERALPRGKPDVVVVVVQGDSKETLRLCSEPYAVWRVRTAMFNGR